VFYTKLRVLTPEVGVPGAVPTITQAKNAVAEGSNFTRGCRLSFPGGGGNPRREEAPADVPLPAQAQASTLAPEG